MLQYTEKQELLYKEGVRLLKEHGEASTSFFQRKLYIGYAAARAIFDRMLDEGITTLKTEFTLTLNKEGERKLKNDTFNGMHAKDFLELVVAREREAKGNEEKPSFSKLTYKKYLDLAKQGYKEAIAHLERISSIRVEKATSEDERNAAILERDFWETVQFMVAEHHYNIGELKYEKHLGFMLMTGVGCDVNTDRGVKLVFSDMERTASSLDSEVKTRAMEICAKQAFRTGVVERMLIDAIWKGDMESAYDIVEKIRSLGIIAEVVNKVSTIFYSRIHDAKKEVKDEV